MKKLTVSDLSTEEKLRLICAKGFWFTEDFDGKLPKVCVSDGPIGLRTETVDENGKRVPKAIPAVSYPASQTVANAWSRKVARKFGEYLSDECIERNVDILLAPGVNIKRHPLNGRNFEYFSEDPYLAGTIAKEYISGLQENGIGACLKHFCCNNLEYNRFNQSSEVDERTLREIYYKPFEIACEAKPVSAMCSYNRINGTYASEYKKGFDVLRNEFGFDGAVYSDWESVRDRVKAAKAGIDIEFPYSEKNYKKLVSDYENGKLSDKELNACVKRVLDLCYRAEEMREMRKIKTTQSDRLRFAEEITAEGAVLLKNDGILPIAKGVSVAVSGCYGHPVNGNGTTSGNGSSRVDWVGKGFDLSASLAKRTGAETFYEKMYFYDGVIGYGETGCTPERGIANAAIADVQVICAGTGALFEYESGDRKTMRLPEVQERAIIDLSAVNPNTIVVLFAGAAIDMSPWIDKVSAVLYVGLCGETGGEAIADILTGNLNPCGKLSETFALSFEDYPAANGYIDARVTRYSEGLDVGYRYFDRHPSKVLFPFGFGLSYSQYEYSALTVKATENGVELAYEIKNVSDRDGKEVSQIYVGEVAPAAYRPIKELKEFDKSEIKAGESVIVKKVLPISAFAHWSEANSRWEVSDGIYKIFVGASSTDIRAEVKLSVKDDKVIKILS